MTGAPRAWCLMGLVLALVMLAAIPTSASQITVANREASYPAGVANVSHEPWNPVRGQDVTVTLTLLEDARQPEAVSLLYCRVEPDYVCGLPLFMDAGADGGTWTGTIRWDTGGEFGPGQFIKDDTEHVGYNVTMRFPGPNGTERVSAPTGNYWVPDAYPGDSEGVYYFLRYTGTETHDAPGLPVLVSAVTVAAVAGAARRRRHGA